jgi:hypothetical protein
VAVTAADVATATDAGTLTTGAARPGTAALSVEAASAVLSVIVASAVLSVVAATATLTVED